MLLDGDDVTFKRASQRDIGFVFQLFALYPHMNVRSNIGFPLKCQGVSRREIGARVEEVAKLLRIEHLIDRPVAGLSGGDSQRVALGRAIVRKAKAFMMDEPLGALDAEFRHLMCVELRALHDRIRATTVYVTHDQVEAMAMADRIAVMNHGVVDQIATPQEIYDCPRTMHVAFIGSPPMNFLHFTRVLRRAPNRCGSMAKPFRFRRCTRASRTATSRSACDPSMSRSPTTAAFEARYSAPSTWARCRS